MGSQVKIVHGCINMCPFYGTSADGMQCNHPYWQNKSAYDNMIITQANGSKGKIPSECPLRNSNLTVIYALKST